MPNNSTQIPGDDVSGGNKRGKAWTRTLEESLATLVNLHWDNLGYRDKTVKNVKDRLEKYKVCFLIMAQYQDGWNTLCSQYCRENPGEENRGDTAIFKKVERIIAKARVF